MNVMNNFRNIIILMAMLAFAGFGCQDENFDAPPHERPVYSGDANISIKEFKAKHNELLKKLTDNDIIQGVITANDESGNLYKQIFIEDETGGLMVAIDRNNIYNDYKVGQKIYIETGGLYMGKYGSLPQLGYQYSRDNDDNFAIGQMTWEQVKTHIFKDDYPNPEGLSPKVIDYNDFTADNFSRLVKLEGVLFDDAGQIFAYPPAEGGVQTLNRIIRFADDQSKTVTGRMSSAADFAADTIPAGVGSVTGILTVFNNTVQFLLRDTDDLDFEPNPDGWGLQNSPWSVSFALGNMDTGKNGWVKGYIVGAVQPGINNDNPINSNDDLAFEGPFMNNTIVIAQSPGETNWEKCVVVNLPSGSTMREVLNLSDNPGNIGKEVTVKGGLETTLGAGGIKIANGTSSEFMFGGAGQEILNASFQSTLEPFTQYSVSGTQKWGIDPYGYAKITGFENPDRFANEDWLISPALDLSDYETAHITFDHITRYGSNELDHTLWISSNYNGGDPGMATWTQITIANYSSGNSWDDWTNSGKLNIPSEFTGAGNIHFALKYISTTSRAGTWEVKNMIVVSGPGDEGGTVEPPPPATGDGTKENPYNYQAAIENQGATGSFWTKAYIVGAVDDGRGSGKSISTEARFTGPFTVSSNILVAASPSETNYTNCIPVQLPIGAVREALNLVDNPGNLGKEVNLYGTLETYFSVPGIKGVSDFEIDGGTVEPPDLGTGDGTQGNPYNYLAAIENQGATGSFWTKAYIVGAVDDGSGSGISISTESRFTTPFTVSSNILIAASPSETNYANCIPVQLPLGTVRDALNLVTNPDNLGKEVNLYGTLEAYFGVPGIKEVSDFEIESGTVEPPPPDGNQIFLETFGTGEYVYPNRPKIADFTDFDNPGITYSDASGTADIRTTTSLSAHVWLPANLDSDLTMDGIDISASQDVQLQFDMSTNGSATADKLIVKINGVEQTVPATPLTANVFSTIVIEAVITATSPLKIEFISVAANNTVGFRLDNIKLTGNPK